MIKQYFIFVTAITVVIIITYNILSYKQIKHFKRKKIHSDDFFIHDYSIEPSHKSCSNKVFFIIIVTSYVGHAELRSAHRRAMPLSLLESMNITRVFLLAKIPDKEMYITQNDIKDESSVYGDILQGTFLENYRNLTHKHLMGLHWASTVCKKASFILKVDDDTVFNLNKTYELLLQSQGFEDTFVMGYMLNNTKPKRNKINKWYVTLEEYQRNEYPPYMSGWYYVTTPKTARKITTEALTHQYFWIDDIFVTGIIAETLNINLKQLPANYWLEYYELLECCLREMITKSVRCDYVVGPNGGRNNLILEFNKAIRVCDTSANCKVRSVKRSLNKVCVAYKERTIFSSGKAQVNTIKI